MIMIAKNYIPNTLTTFSTCLLVAGTQGRQALLKAGRMNGTVTATTPPVIAVTPANATNPPVDLGFGGELSSEVAKQSMLLLDSVIVCFKPTQLSFCITDFSPGATYDTKTVVF